MSGILITINIRYFSIVTKNLTIKLVKYVSLVSIILSIENSQMLARVQFFLYFQNETGKILSRKVVTMTNHLDFISCTISSPTFFWLQSFHQIFHVLASSMPTLFMPLCNKSSMNHVCMSTEPYRQSVL